MLDPNKRSLLTSLLTPPLGLVFDKGLAMTYSLNPLSLLGVPVHLAWMASQDDTNILREPIRLLEALHRVAKHLTVFTDRGRITVPGQSNALFAMLESTIVEVKAPNGGAFHPKLWLLRFTDPKNERVPLVRLGILSRNLTSDCCWDLSLVLEGAVQRTAQAENRPLYDLVKTLPEWSASSIKASRKKQVAELANDLLCAKLELPSGWDEVRFHVLGRKPVPWSVGQADEIAIISPFLTDAAIEQTCKEVKERCTLISRPDTLSALSPQTRASFSKCQVLAERAETEDGEEGASPDTVGLHAKVVLLRRAWRSHLFVGSANVTSAAMIAGRNIEVMAELIGKHSNVGKISDLLSTGGFGNVLTDFKDADVIKPEDAAVKAVRDELETLHQAIADVNLKAECVAGTEGLWQVRLSSTTAINTGDSQVSAWLLSQHLERAVNATPLMQREPLLLAPVASADVTGLVGFALFLEGQTLYFALNLPLKAPEDRDAAILRRFVQNREGFVRYLKLLLGGLEQNFKSGPSDETGMGLPWKKGLDDSTALLEDLVRLWSREPSRLDEVARVVECLRGATCREGDVVPPEFDSLWRVFEAARVRKGR